MTKKEDVIDLGKYLSRQNEEKGIWHEISVTTADGNRVATGVEVKLYGPNSKIASEADAVYSDELKEADKIQNVAEKNDRLERALARKYAALTADIRAKDGKKLVLNGKEDISKEILEELYYGSPSFIVDVGTFSRNQNNFLVLE